MSRIQKILIGVLLCAITVLTLGCVHLYILTRDKPAPVTVISAREQPVNETAAPVVISEFMEKNRAVVTDEDGDCSDWIELWNSSDVKVSLDGWRISDSEAKAGWRLDGITLEGGERLLLFTSGKDRRGKEYHTDFSLSEGESIYLFSEKGAVADTVDCLGSEKDIAMARTADGGMAQTLFPTPGFPNDSAGYESFQETLTPAGPLIISEAMVYNDILLSQGPGEYPDWVELRNISHEAVRLSDYYISDDNDERLLCRLPDRMLGAGEVCLLLCAPVPSWESQYDYTGFELDSGNEQLYLSGADGTLTDVLSLRGIPYRCSFGRMDGENGAFYFDTPSPGKPNSGGKRLVADPPVCLTRDGVYEGVDTVTVELSGSGEIRYTLDGSRPGPLSQLYTSPITLDKTTVLRAVCCTDNAIPSGVLTRSFILNEGHTLPVVSLAADDPNSFRGMYNGMAKSMELSGNIAFYDGEDGFNINCGVSLNGMTSLIMTKKNMYLRFRDAYGSGMLDYDLYGGGVTEFSGLLLRAGQDQNDSIIRNELVQELAFRAGNNILNQRSRFCVLYINGEYRGIYTLKEKADEQLYASAAGVSRDSVELLEASVPYASELFQQVIHFCLVNDMSKGANYRHICSLVDMDSLIDWTIIESFSANVDLTSGNLRYCRSSEADGKWRFMLYDLDATFRSEGGVYMLLSDYGFNNLQVSSILVPLMDNAEYRERFLKRAAELYSTVLSNQSVLDEIDALADAVRAETPRDMELLGRTQDQWERSLDDLRYLITNSNWRQLNIDRLCQFCDVSGAERAKYFGKIDGK